MLATSDDDFARSGAFVIAIVLACEMYVLNKLSSIKNGVAIESSRAAQDVNYHMERAGRIPRANAAVLTQEAINEIVTPREKRAQLHILAMAILGTLTWGYGDLIYNLFA